MRDTKFRVWDKENKKWIDDIDIAINQNGLLFIRHEHQTDLKPMSFTKSSNFEIVWFTGLKDKNLKEIYEGDLVKDELKNVWIIEWTDGGGRLLPGYQLKIVNLKGTTALMTFIGKQIEIIGNIYENKELLKI